MASQASNLSVIGRAARVHGRVTGAVDLEVQGYVEGDIAVGGDVTVDGGGMVGANVHGRRLVVRGAVKGDLLATESVSLEEGARVVGDVRAPRVAIAGGLVRGYVQSGDVQGAPRAVVRAVAVARPAPAPAKAPVSMSAAVSAPQASNGTPAKKVAPPPPVSAPTVRHVEPAPRAISLGGSGSGAPAAKHGPPPPVVPALKKGAKGALKKKA